MKVNGDEMGSPMGSRGYDMNESHEERIVAGKDDVGHTCGARPTPEEINQWLMVINPKGE
jgi:hypothetical protein